MVSKDSDTDTKKSNVKSAKKKRATLASQIINTANEIDRHRMIATAAYFRAEKRGFKGNGADAEQDWLVAEQEIANRL